MLAIQCSRSLAIRALTNCDHMQQGSSESLCSFIDPSCLWNEIFSPAHTGKLWHSKTIVCVFAFNYIERKREKKHGLINYSANTWEYAFYFKRKENTKHDQSSDFIRDFFYLCVTIIIQKALPCHPVLLNYSRTNLGLTAFAVVLHRSIPFPLKSYLYYLTKFCHWNEL